METTDEMQARWSKSIADAGAMTEKDMREVKEPWPRTPEELATYINALVTRPHDYGTCVYAMSLAAVAAFNYVSHILGVTGFQASCADMDIIRRTRSLAHGFMIVDAGKLLYPQHSPLKDVAEFLEKRTRELGPAARKLIAGDEKRTAHPAVRAHWEMLAAQPDPPLTG